MPLPAGGKRLPFYFCPRSVMLYMMSVRSEQLTYKGGQGPIVHLVADLQATVAWAAANAKRWVFTLSNAGSYYFEDRADLAHLGDINWDAVRCCTARSDCVCARSSSRFAMRWA